MVRIQEASEYERLDRLLRELCERHGFNLDVTGWTRKTYDVFADSLKEHRQPPIARVESFVTTSGEIRVFDDQALAFAEELGRVLEASFGLAEAVILKEAAPQ